MAQKRTSDAFEDSESDCGPVNFAKRAKYALPSLPPDPLKEMGQTELEKLSHNDLVEYAISLQDTLQKTLAALRSEKEKNKSLRSENETLLKDANERSAMAPRTANSVAAVQTLSPTQIAERADELACMCARGIQKQMKWQLSCKNGKTRWSFSGVSPNPEVFFKMLRLPPNGKPWKQKKISTEHFQDAVGDINSLARFTRLRITSAEVNVNWTPETNEFSLSGTYGF